MSEPAASRAGAGAPPSPAEVWDGLVRPDVEGAADYWAGVSARMRDARLTFGGRPLCPFLRPFFVDAADEARVRTVAETIAAIGERVVAAAMAQPELLRRVRLTEAETRAGRHRSRLRAGQHDVAARRVPPARLAHLRGIQRRVAGRPGLRREPRRGLRRARPHDAVPRTLRGLRTSACRRTCSTRCSPAMPSGAAAPVHRPS